MYESLAFVFAIITDKIKSMLFPIASLNTDKDFWNAFEKLILYSKLKNSKPLLK